MQNMHHPPGHVFDNIFVVCNWSGWFWSCWTLQSFISIACAVKCFEMLSHLISYIGGWCITCPRTFSQHQHFRLKLIWV